MKNITLLITALTLISTIAIQGCDKSSNKMDKAETAAIEAERDMAVANSELQAEIQIFRLEANNEITENNRSIAAIKREIQNTDANVREAHVVRIENLERSNQNMKRQIDNYRQSNKANWDSFKKDFNSNMNELEISLSDFFSTTTTSRN
jgi:hypothetical protein